MNQIVIQINDLNKVYKLYDKPTDRLKEAFNLKKKKYYSKFYALKGISFDIKKGENVGIIGTNGAGKSTLLKIITGVLSPTKGDVSVDGKISALLELGVGFNMEYTGMENIYLTGTLMGYSKETMNEKLQSILNFADIGEFIYQPVKTYSSGMFTRLAFAVSINVDPEILIVDEALSVGDVRFQTKCMDKMKEMIYSGVTVLFVSHDMNAVRKFCNKVLWIDQGKMIQYGETNVVIDSYLDYLKHGQIVARELKEVYVEELKEFEPSDCLAEIISFTVTNQMGHTKAEFMYNDKMKINVVYDVYDDKIPNPVIGIAVRGMDDDYVCGLNTLLDHIKIPWVYGRNRIELEYPHGIRANAGKYYFDIAIFEETATVPIQYISMVKEIVVKAEYESEGRYFIPHNWRHEV